MLPCASAPCPYLVLLPVAHASPPTPPPLTAALNPCSPLTLSPPLYARPYLVHHTANQMCIAGIFF